MLMSKATFGPAPRPVLSPRPCWRGVRLRRRGATDRWTGGALIGIGAGLGVAVGVLVSDAVIGLAVGAGFYAVATRIIQAWDGRSDQQARHP